LFFSTLFITFALSLHAVLQHNIPKMETIKLKAINIADNINIKPLKANFTGHLIMSTSTELFYKTGENKFISIFNYGVIAFSDHTQAEREQVIDSIAAFCNDKQEILTETLQIEFKAIENISYKNDILTVPAQDRSDELFRIVMFDLSQTVALDYYAGIAEKLLHEVKTYATQLARKGKISLSKRSMMKFVGKSLNTRNEIIDNLFIFDSPDIAWDDERVERVHKILTRVFDLNVRFKELEYTFNIIDNNLQIFNDSYEHRYSSFLEIVVIILILIEVVKSFAETIW
jgi:required for meiotic nuclear division protein 1